MAYLNALTMTKSHTLFFEHLNDRLHFELFILAHH